MSALLTFFLDLMPYTTQFLNESILSPKYKKNILAGKVFFCSYMLIDMMNMIFVQKQQSYVENIYLKAMSYVFTFLMVSYHFYIECQDREREN